MTDLVVTVPKWFWPEWIAEGDAAGEPWSGQHWDFGFQSKARPSIEPGERLYIVAHERLRGYAPVLAVEGDPYDWRIVRGGDAVAVTLPHAVQGFRRWRRRWWDRMAEIPFPDWKTANVATRKAA
jgi:hypothetical protein